MPLIRRASHAGNWYTDNWTELDQQLQEWLSKAEYRHGPARAVIVPHAGYSYSGPTAGHGYRQIDPKNVKRIFILGPSHFVRVNSGCALTKTAQYETPLYNLNIDEEINKRLEATGQFERMSQDTDENEHSIEMQLPYLAKVMENYRNQFTIIPVLVGSINSMEQYKYGDIFAPYLNDPQNLFVISSDFCHWGRRFRYTYFDKSKGEIYKSIEHLDKMGMNIIEELNAYDYEKYLNSYGNTICGRNPIGVLLYAIQKLLNINNGLHLELKFLKYAQSSQCRTMDDSSVSYATASVVIQ
ncbi:protein MEMO1 [Chrysoperla carnea]|uniref:protein MEMO1 n=1 Tax=Chrysoperla carnea TaxID=189513 RepID=UPI001D06795E|nr:protein MEMO1 [Chrysoperla carnea]